MKGINSKNKVAVALIVLLAGSVVFAAGGETQEDKLDFQIGAGFIFSPGYRDFIDKVYGDYDSTGGYGWMALHAGLEYKETPAFSIIAACDLWLNGVDVSGGAQDESYVNTMVLPSVYVQYQFLESYTDYTESCILYVNAGIGMLIPSTGSDYSEFDAAAPTIAGNVGWTFGSRRKSKLELGYMFAYVDAEATGSNPVLTGSRKFDFGGFQLRYIQSF